MGQYTPRPVLLTLGKHRDFDKLSGNARPTWYDRWASAALGRQTLLAQGQAADVYHAAFEVLEASGILVRTTHHLGDTLALNPDALEVDTEVAFIATAGDKRRLAVPRQDAGFLLGMPCMDAVESVYEQSTPQAADWWSRRFQSWGSAAGDCGRAHRPAGSPGAGGAGVALQEQGAQAVVRESAVRNAYPGNGRGYW
jgi:DEAD/DEAH box helicase domain-containing protein